MAETIPPVPPLPITPAASQPPPPVAEVPAPPPALVLLPPGTRLDATVTARLAPDTFQLVTPQATFIVQTPLPLEVGSRLLLQLPERPVAGFSIQLLALNGRPAAVQTLGNAAVAVAPSSPSIAAGSTLLAIVLAGTQQPRVGATGPAVASLATVTSPVAGAPTATPGTAGAIATAGTATVTTAGGVPGADGISGAFRIVPAAPGSDTLAAAQIAARAVHDYARQASLSGPEGQRVILRVVSIGSPPAPGGATPAAAAPVSVPLTPGTTISGVVTGRLPQGFPVVQTPVGLLALTTLADIEPGTEISLRVVAPASARAPQPSQAGLPIDGEVAALRDWPALHEALVAMQTMSPPTARAMSDVLPRFDATLTASVLFLLVSLRGGNLRDWMGETTVRELQRLRPDLVARISEDFSRFGIAANDPGADWRSFLLPFFTGDTIHPVRLFVHRHPPEEDAEKEAGTRFVVDVALSRLGRLQIDGLVYEKMRRFDLILRTAQPLLQDIQSDIRNMFATALEATGQTGAIAFRADPAAFIEPQPGGPATPGVSV